MAGASDFRALQRQNRRETVILIAVFMTLFVALGCGLDFLTGSLRIYDGRVIGAPFFTFIALAFAIFQSMASYWGGASLILASVHAQPLTPDTNQHQVVLNVIQEMAIASKMP